MFFGAIAGLDLVWNLADLFMAIMTITNLIAIALLGHIALKVLADYNRQKQAGIKSPAFKASAVLGKDNGTTEWEG